MNNVSELPLVSVGIPTFNRPESLKRVLIEITQQTYKNLEIIVSDNASTGSETESVVREIMQNDSRVKYFKQLENIGPVHNFQFVLMQSNGEYFMWAADDDWHKEDYIEVLCHNLISDASAVVSFCDFDSRDENGNIVSGYPNFYATLKKMCHASNFIRQVHFFLLREGSAKPHPIYGLICRKKLQGLSWVTFVEKHGWNACDVLFVFYLMTHGRLALSDQRLFGCTVGNFKNYESNESQWSLSKYSIFMAHQLTYLLGYLKIAKGLVRIALIVLFPIKLLEIIYLFAVKPCINMMQRYLRKLAGNRS